MDIHDFMFNCSETLFLGTSKMHISWAIATILSFGSIKYMF